LGEKGGKNPIGCVENLLLKGQKEKPEKKEKESLLFPRGSGRKKGEILISQKGGKGLKWKS